MRCEERFARFEASISWKVAYDRDLRFDPANRRLDFQFVFGRIAFPAMSLTRKNLAFCFRQDCLHRRENRYKVAKADVLFRT